MPNSRSMVVVVAALLVGSLAGAGVAQLAPPRTTDGGDAGTFGEDGDVTTNETDAAVARFDSERAYVEYVRSGRNFDGVGDVYLQRDVSVSVAVETAESGAAFTAKQAPDDAGGDGGAGSANTARRYSGTNVQEAGLSEPDVVKGDGETFYVADEAPVEVLDEERLDEEVKVEVEGDAGAPPERREGRTAVVSASEPADPEVVANVSVSGRYLLANDTLVVLQDERVLGYDVSDPANPERTWSHPLNGSLVTARLYAGQLYLVTESSPSLEDPCPVEPLGSAVSVPCTDVYHPRTQVAVDATYTAMSLDPTDGSVSDSVGFVGTSAGTVVYMSENALYVTYTKRDQRGELYVDYLLSEAPVPSTVTERVRQLRAYNISAASLHREARLAVREWLATLSPEQRQEKEQALKEGFRDYLAAHQRQRVRTGIVRIPVDESGSLSVDTVGTVAGTPLNQFSLDEHDGTLRITTTVPEAGHAGSANDLYVLDATTMEVVGATKGMGLTERVYSVRYVGDTAYVVTFRRVDPFHVVDLSDPTDPTVDGKLKLPGYSSYLHPVNESYVLGIGRDGDAVKAVLFDVSDPTDPTVADDFLLDDQWSAIAESHHAFLLDRRHGVFFLPTDEGGHVISYRGGDLSLQTTVDVADARRARYLGDYLYVFGRQTVAVVDERTWNRTATLDL